MLNIAIVGSGATAISVIEAALSTNLEIQIHLFDPWNELPQFEQSTNAPTLKQMAKKSRFGSFAMYEYPTQSVYVDPNLHIPLSSSVGGLTAVWGANSIIPDAGELTGYAKNFADESIQWVKKFATIVNLADIPDPDKFFVSERFRKSLITMKSKPGLDILPATLSLNTNSCTKIGGCLSGCVNHAIFNAEQEIYRLVKEGKICLQVGFVQGIEANQNQKFSLRFESRGLIENTNFSYDKVFVACGSIASCALLQRSGFIPHEIQLKDTQAFYSAFLIRKKMERNLVPFELAQMFIKRPQLLHISVYEFSNQFIRRAKIILGPLVRLIPQKLWHHVIAGIGFINSSDSGYLNLEYKDSRTYVTQFPNQKSKRVISQNLVSVKKCLSRGGIFHIPFLNQIPNVGASYHVGSANIAGENLFSSTGKIADRPDLELYVVDASSLSQLPVGPITTTVMASAYGRTKLALHNG